MGLEVLGDMVLCVLWFFGPVVFWYSGLAWGLEGLVKFRKFSEENLACNSKSDIEGRKWGIRKWGYHI